MQIGHLLAVVHVTDIEVSRAWYAALFGRCEDNNPMPTLVEWQVLPGAWVQVFRDPVRAGTDEINVAVDDLERHIDELRERGLSPGAIAEANKGVRLSRFPDPDGNVVSLIGGFRVDY
ncbi:glyoxalase [Mycolicibacterium duvalii]|uniref:Glyoxalase n=1 Tax=Mycolicibacterium duvalii TaxID=39688 RepID=A0A7I7K4N2_9MYCO|nr:VOC family protein [Mycolicibacterium duvalii]MCV7369063.1 VOC family protein [Mycolicibacterium duvalii]PEG36186.1 glyoxalase [Mycolicibacterium duvalii]BBX19037.1 glyoxalase [Mycolicibacterium duvalii]